MDFVTPRSPPVLIGASEFELEPMGDFEQGHLDRIMREAAELEQVRREKQRQRMVLYRCKKKERMSSLHQERQRLEEILEERIARMRLADSLAIKTTRPKEEAVHHLAIEQGQLARENLSLRHARDEGWYVHFPDNSPSFYFQPLSQPEFDMSRDLHVNTSPCVATVGNIFGWTVDYAPVTRNESDSAFMAHARFSRQVRCTLDDAATILPRTDSNSWPVVVAARSWGLEQSGRHCCVELQQLDYSCRVAVCNIPGDINLRYIAALRHYRDTQANGKRVDTYSLTITDSKKNALLREMEGQQQNVQWILNGGCIATFTEVDDTTINIVYDHWAGCISEVHGHDLYIDWVQHAVRLEHIISPARMLHN